MFAKADLACTVNQMLCLDDFNEKLKLAKQSNAVSRLEIAALY